jgi:hypothetical protein
MLYFRINVTPAEGAPSEAIAHVLIEAEGIQKAAAEVVRRLHADRWRIIDVLTARTLHSDERFRGNEPLAQALREAEERGFSFYVETPFVQEPVYDYSGRLPYPESDSAEGSLQAS